LALKKNPFPIGLILGGLAIGLFPILLSGFPFGEAIIRTFVMLGLTSIVLTLAKKIPRVAGVGVWISFVAANLVSTFVSLLAADAIFGKLFAFADIPVWIALFLWQLQLTFFSSVVSEVLTTRAEMRRQLIESLGKDQLDSDVRSALVRLKNRELAQYIHGNIQNKLLSFALKFDQENLSTDDVSRLLDEVEALFSTAISDYQTVDAADLAKLIA
jgi:hypothetical protein